jgi:hypothetical protein
MASIHKAPNILEIVNQEISDSENTPYPDEHGLVKINRYKINDIT